MKSIIFSLLLMVTGMSAQAQTPSDLFQQFKNKENAEYVHLGRLLCFVLRPIANHHADDPHASSAIRRVRSLRSLDLEDCEQEVRNQFVKVVNGLKIKGYHELVSSSSEGERTRVLVRQKGSSIRELLLINAGDDDCSLVQIKCKVKPKDLETIAGVIKK